MARKSLGGPGRLQNKNARTAFTARHELAVVASFRELGDISAVIRELYPNLACSTFESRRKLIYQWIRDREALERVCASPVQAEKKKARSLGVATILSAEDERVSVTWINELRGFGVPTTTTMVQLKAREVARASETASFTASNTWLKLFKNRHKFSMRARTRKGQSTPTEADQVAVDFGKKVRQMASDLGVSKIYNADQTDVCLSFCSPFASSPLILTVLQPAFLNTYQLARLQKKERRLFGFAAVAKRRSVLRSRFSLAQVVSSTHLHSSTNLSRPRFP